MFQKKDVIFNENLGVCKVEDIVKLSPNKTNVYNYYVLRPVYDKEKKAYIPVENHTTMLRELISEEEARKLMQEGMDNKSELIKDEVRYVLDEKGE